MGGWDPAIRTIGPGTHVLTSWLFLRLLGFIYLTAFASLALQIRGLCGRGGVLPVAHFLTGRQHWGTARFWRWPSLFWWNTSDGALLALTWGGAALSLLLIVGIAPIPVLALLWVFYLSLFTAGRVFLCYQWDILLLETGLLALFLAPPRILPQFPPRYAPPSVALWLFWWLLFRLMFWSGAVKVRSGDRVWRDFTALKYHYQTQPLPTRLAWYLHHCPPLFQKCSVGIVLGIELVAPFLIPLPAPFRPLAAWLFIGLMVLIELTGNYAFFNWLGIALSLLLLDDGLILRLSPPAWNLSNLQLVSASQFSEAFTAGMAMLVLFLSADSTARLFRIEIAWPASLSRLLDRLEPFHLVNSYGLFAVMTLWRPEIILEGSHDGRLWHQYEFRWKPGDVRRPPRFVAPHQPRLDWQMWFAALGAPVSELWLAQLSERLLQNSPAVVALLKTNPFPENPPRHVRAVLYEYRFSSALERRATGAWWCRDRRFILQN